MTNPRDVIERVLNEHLWLHDRINLAACLCGQWQRPYHDDEARKLWEAHRAKAVETALADAGLLLPDGVETREEWQVECPNAPHMDFSPGVPTYTVHAEDEQDADRVVANAAQHGLTLRKRRRYVHEEPWQPAPDPDTTPTQEQR